MDDRVAVAAATALLRVDFFTQGILKREWMSVANLQTLLGKKDWN